MNIGISSSCFYPSETLQSFEKVCRLGAKTAEVFINTSSETKKPFLDKMKKLRDFYGVDIVSFHPYASFAEGFYLFSNYQKRWEDSKELYKHLFFAAGELGARYYILHGAVKPCLISREEYAERFVEFSALAKTFGLTVLHENVVHYVGEDIDFLEYLNNQMGGELGICLDVKQARRANVDPLLIVDRLGGCIKHLHLSSTGTDFDCVCPNEGDFEFFDTLFSRMKAISFCGDAIVEVYKKSYQDENEIKKAMEFLQGFATT